VAVTVDQRFPSPLRYPGGKGKLAEFIKLFMLENDLVGTEYVEPYAGGASVALSLLFEGYADHIHINDVNPSVATFWRAVVTQPDALCQLIATTDITVNEWNRQRAVQADRRAPELDVAFSTLFLSRTSRSGIIGAGVIGGLNQSGHWKIDARFNRDDLIRRVKKIARHRSRITVTELDAQTFITDRLPGIQPAFVYLDPPYYVKGEGLYQNFYTHADHAVIASLVAQMTHPWVVSYDSADEILELYANFERLDYRLSYSAQRRYQGTEQMFFKPGLRLPNVASPASVSWKLVDKARLARTRC
jgi:DNA adenine methylase